jgi:hypothetical protein
VRSEDIPVEGITIGPRHRTSDEAKVKAIAESMRQLGLQQPISVWTEDGITIHLVAGLHRLMAAISLGWEDIPCFLVEMDERDRQLWEIDENLCRAELSPVQIAEHTVARKAVWEAKRAAAAVEQPALALEPDGEGGAAGGEGHAQELGGASCPTKLRKDGHRAGPQNQPGFAADTAKKTGRNKRNINKALARAEKIAPDVRQNIVGTKLDTGASLDRLAKLTHEEQRKVVAAGGFPPTPSAISSAPVTTARARPTDDKDATSPPPSIHEMVGDLVARLPASDDPEQLLDLLEQMTSLAADMCDVFLDAGDDGGAAAIAREFGLPLSLMPLNYGTVFDAIDAAKLGAKEVQALGGRHFVNDRKRRSGSLSMEDVCDYLKLLERIGLWPKGAPKAPTVGCDEPVAGVDQTIVEEEGGMVLGRDAVARAVGGGVNAADSVAAVVEQLQSLLLD